MDSEGRRCGNVDDLELDGVAAGEPRVVAILTGPPAWRGRGLFGRLAREHRSAVSSCAFRGKRWPRSSRAYGSRKPAKELRLGRGDDRLRRWIEKIPGSQL